MKQKYETFKITIFSQHCLSCQEFILLISLEKKITNANNVLGFPSLLLACSEEMKKYFTQ